MKRDSIGLAVCSQAAVTSTCTLVACVCNTLNVPFSTRVTYKSVGQQSTLCLSNGAQNVSGMHGAHDAGASITPQSQPNHLPIYLGGYEPLKCPKWKSLTKAISLGREEM